jgi:hypothetical protein
MLKVVCPYCGQDARLVDSSILFAGKNFGMVWMCGQCDARVCTKREEDEHIPLGTLAKKELRDWRRKAHDVFDRLWKSDNRYIAKGMKRTAAYKLLQHIMGLDSPKKAHIACFNIEQCKLLIDKLATFNEWLTS